MTTASAPLGRVEPVATSVQRPDATRFRGTPSAYSVSIRRSVTGLNFPARNVSRATTAYPSIAARSESGTSMGERTSSADTRWRASRIGTVSFRSIGRTGSIAIRIASSREMSAFRGRMPCPACARSSWSWRRAVNGPSPQPRVPAPERSASPARADRRLAIRASRTRGVRDTLPQSPQTSSRAFSFPLVQGDWQRRDDVWGDCGSVSRSPRVLLARIARRLSARAGEADRSGAGTRGWGDGPLTAHLHDHEDRAHAGHGMRPLKALISLDEAMRIAMDLVRPIERKETDPILDALHRGSAEDDRAPRSLVVREGEVLTPAKVGALAAIGMARASAYAKPRVSILTTGDEVVPPGKPIRAGQVYDINSHTMASVVRENGGEPVLLGRVSDRLESLRSALKKAIANDLVVFSGGSSAGEKNIIVDVLRSMGDLLFHGIAVKPGKPPVLGRLDRKAVLGMPGYPMSSLDILFACMTMKLTLSSMTDESQHYPHTTGITRASYGISAQWTSSGESEWSASSSSRGEGVRSSAWGSRYTLCPRRRGGSSR